MPTHKSPLQRLHNLHRLFCTRTSAYAVVTTEEMTEALNISVRQLRYDMDVLKEKGAPLEYDGRLRGWRYTPGVAFELIGEASLTAQDLTILRIAVETLAKVNHLKEFKQLPDVFKKIYRAAKRWSVNDGKVVGKTIYFDPLPHYDGGKHLPMMLEAIEQHRQVRFDYHAFHADTPRPVVLEPWFLRHYDRRWYVGGRAPAEDLVRTFPLERIAGTPVLGDFFHDKPPQYDAETYWKHIYGITVPPHGRVERVVLAFNALQGKYFRSTPFFEPYHVVEDTPERLVVEMHLMVNIDLVRKLASLANEVRVLSPSSLIQQMQTFFQQAQALYSPEAEP